MGASIYRSFDYTAGVDALRATGKIFARSSAAAATGDYTGSISDILNPRNLKNGMRESCYADGFNDVLSVVISIDGTGSMQRVPYELQERLPTLIDLLTTQGITDHPNILFMCHDDETVVPNAAFQMSQFEIGATELVTALNEMVIPYQGGGNDGESYHLALYAAANHTTLESFEQEGKRGFMFMICDEQPFFDKGDPAKRGTTPTMAAQVFGDSIEKEVPMVESLRSLLDRYYFFCIRPGHTSHGTNKGITRQWQNLVQDAGGNPEYVLEVDATDEIVSTIAMCIGRLHGMEEEDIVDVLTTMGSVGVVGASRATAALVPVVGVTSVARKASGTIQTAQTPHAGRARV